MATFDHLVSEAQPYVTQAMEEATEGKSWEFYTGAFECLDDDGVYSEVDLTGCTAEWKVLDSIDGSVLVTLTATITSDNQVKGVAAPSDTAGKGGNGFLGRICPWYLTLTDASSRQVAVFVPENSRLVIKQGE